MSEGSCQHRRRLPPQLQPIRLAIEAAVDPTGDGFELVGVGHRVQTLRCPEPGGRQARILRLLQQLGMVDQIQSQRFAARRIVRPAGDLDQSSTPVLETVAGTVLPRSARPSYLA